MAGPQRLALPALSLRSRGDTLVSMTPADVVRAALYGSARAMVPKSGLPVGGSYIMEWSPSSVAKTVPTAVATALTPHQIVHELAPAELAKNWVQNLAVAAVVAVML